MSYLDNLDPTPDDYVSHVITVGCAFGSVVEFPEIPIPEAVQTCHAIRDQLDAALLKEAREQGGDLVSLDELMSEFLCECEAQGAPTKCGACG